MDAIRRNYNAMGFSHQFVYPSKDLRPLDSSFFFGGSTVGVARPNSVAARYLPLFAGCSFQALQLLLTLEFVLQASPVQLDCSDGLEQVGADSPKTRVTFTRIPGTFIA